MKDNSTGSLNELAFEGGRGDAKKRGACAGCKHYSVK